MGKDGGGSTLFHIEREIKFSSHCSELYWEKNNKQQVSKYKMFFNIKTLCYWKKLFFSSMKKNLKVIFHCETRSKKVKLLISKRTNFPFSNSQVLFKKNQWSQSFLFPSDQVWSLLSFMYLSIRTRIIFITSSPVFLLLFFLFDEILSISWFIFKQFRLCKINYQVY